MGRIVGLSLLMLVVFWATNTWLLSFGVHWTLRDVQFALALSLFFGTMVAVPAVVYLLSADFIAGRLTLPWSAILYVGLVALGCVLHGAILHFVVGRPLPQASESWHLYQRQYIPLLAMASVPLVCRIAKAFRARSKRSPD